MRFPQLLRPDSPYSLLDFECQDSGGTTVVVDGSNYALNGSVSANNISYYSTTGPGHTLTKAFDGNTLYSEVDKVQLYNRIVLPDSSPGTIECFFKFASTSNGTIPFTLETDGNGSFYAQILNGYFRFGGTASTSFGTTGDTKAADTRWHHVSFVIGADNSVTGYLDGDYTLVFGAGRVGNSKIDAFLDGSVATQCAGVACGFKIYGATKTRAEMAESAKAGAIGRICPTSLSLLGVG